MSIESVLYSTLSPLTEGRVYPFRMPEKTLFPVIVYFQVVGHPIQSQTTMKRNPRYQVDVWAQTFESMVSTAAAVINVLDHYNDGTCSALFEQESEIPDPATGLFRRVLEFYLWGN